ncbi:MULTISPECIES: OadG family transporter subunit [unclassified Blautia]|uniref:OadG family transporter subunit n=1 Tax=unclassified Blautia TaxID=2648079 RepID=UPI003F898CEC
MKMIKKITSVFMTFLVMAALVIGSTSVVFAADEADADTESKLIQYGEWLTDQIISMTDEDIETYLKAEDAFTVNAAQVWKDSKDELGKQKKDEEKKDEEKKDKSAKTTVDLKNGQYVVTVPKTFEKTNANFVYVFSNLNTVDSVSIDVQYGMAKTLQRAGLNTLMGIGTVFVMLVLLSLLISLFRFIPNPEAKKAAEAKAAKAAKEAEAAAIAQTAPTQAEENLADDGELVAVIAAAIAAAEGTTTDGFVVRSIRKVKRNRR